MCEINNVYIDVKGNVSLDRGCRLASITDLKDYACLDGQEFGGFLQLSDGIYFGTTTDMLEEELEKINEELDGTETAEYDFIDVNVPKIYKRLIEQIDPILEEIITMKMTGENTMLYAVTHQRNSNFYHIHNLWLNEEDEIMENCSMLPRIFIDKYKIA